MPTPIPNIWQLQTKGDIDGLIETLHHPDAGTRRGAAAALRALGAWQAVPALQSTLAIEHDWQVHATIVAALQYLDHDIHIETLVKNRDVRGLSKMLNSTRVDEVITACEALATIGDRQAVEPLVMIFRNPMLPNKSRLAAAEALLRLESAPTVVTLLGALRRDDWQVRRNAAAVLGQLQATWATDPLIKSLGDPNSVVARTAAAALRRIATPEAIRAVNGFEEAQRRLAAQQATQPQIVRETTESPQVSQPGTVRSDSQLKIPIAPASNPGDSQLRPPGNLTNRGKTGILPPLSELRSVKPEPAIDPNATRPKKPTGELTKVQTDKLIAKLSTSEDGSTPAVAVSNLGSGTIGTKKATGELVKTPTDRLNPAVVTDNVPIAKLDQTVSTTPTAKPTSSELPPTPNVPLDTNAPPPNNQLP